MRIAVNIFAMSENIIFASSKSVIIFNLLHLSSLAIYKL